MVRTIAQVSRLAYSISTDGLWVNLYGGNVLATQLPDGSAVKLRRRPTIPGTARCKLTIEAAPKKAFALMLRIPGWAEGASVAVNGRRWSRRRRRGST